MANIEIGTSTCNTSGGEYQVFLNFCGSDTRRGFTNSLYHILIDAGIRVFIDDEELPPGERFSSNLLQAINDSKLYITIFSPNYASSHWCLRELAKIVENTSRPEEDGNKKVILPIFYEVKPDDVKLKTDLYNKAISELEQKMEDQKKKFSTEEVETWRRALKKVDAIQGWELEKYRGDGHLSRSVVEEVVNRLQTRQQNVTKDLVGLEVRIAAINNLLDIDSGGVRLIGIYGMGGLGKTTLAKEMFNQLYPRFGKKCSFLDNVSETAKTQGLVKLQQQLLSDISNSRGVHSIGSSDHGINRIEETICNKKVLIVLDDVDEGKQIEELIGMNSLASGTRILITTRDKGVLKVRGFKYEIVPYEMEGLSDKDALQLFSRHAFDDNSPPADYYTLSKDIVSTTGGLPLALQAIGSLLFDQKKIEVWEEMLRKLWKTPIRDVLGKLRISYDALETDQKQIFLDVACFFADCDKTKPIFMWEACGFSPNLAIDVLIKRCMIKVLDNERFWMHDQFRHLGRVIAKEERIWLCDKDDIICELRSTEIKRTVQALYFPLELDNPITVTAKEIERFPNLRFLWLDFTIFQGGFTGCLSKLKWVHVTCFSPNHKSAPLFMATNLHLEDLVVMSSHGFEWTEDAVRSLFKGARKLKVLTLGGCQPIHRTPPFPQYSVLEKLNIRFWGFLKEIDCSIGKLRWLTALSVEYCEALEKLPEQIGELKNLQDLSLIGCRNLRKLPDSVSKLESLTKLCVSCTSITRLPGTMSELRRLQKLNLMDCHEIQELPELPRSLTTLQLRSKSLQTLPDLSSLANLVEVFLSNASEVCNKSNINLDATSAEWGSLSRLEQLTLSGLNLQSLKILPSNLTVLELDNTQVKRVELDGLPQLEQLTISRCELVKRLSIPSRLRKLREVEVSSCTELVEVQFLNALISLEVLYIIRCESFERLVYLSEEPRCNELQAPELTNGQRRVLRISSSLKMLHRLWLWGCPKLQEIQFVSPLEALTELNLDDCISLKRIGGLSNLKYLRLLKFKWCESLQVVEGIDELEFLGWLEVSKNMPIERIIDASRSKIPNECRIIIWIRGEFYRTLGGPGYTWKSCRELILNGSIPALDSLIQKANSGAEAEDPLLKTDQENKGKKRGRNRAGKSRRESSKKSGGAGSLSRKIYQKGFRLKEVREVEK